MKTLLLLVFALILSVSSYASDSEFDVEEFANNYFKAWMATQSPEAKKSDIQNYLSLLKDDVGHQHLPYDPDAKRASTGKQNMLEGMLYYLATHTQYSASLTNVVGGHEVVIIKYSTQSTGKHPQTGQIIEQAYDTVEVLELEDGKVAIIRKYSE